VRKKEEEKYFLFFFFTNRFFAYLDNKPWDFPIVFDLKYKQHLDVLVACVYFAEARDMPTSSGVLALGWENTFYPNVFLRSHFSLMILLVIGTRRICLL
jgi:hypothetical protein